MSDHRILHILERCLRYSPFVAIAGLVVAGCTASVSADGGGGGDITPPTGCTADSTLNCDTGDGFACAAGDRPETEDSSLVCSDDPTADPNGDDDFCCITFASSASTCTEDATVTATCEYPSYGFTCAAMDDDPTSIDSTLNCSSGTDNGDGTFSFCCT